MDQLHRDILSGMAKIASSIKIIVFKFEKSYTIRVEASGWSNIGWKENLRPGLNNLYNRA